MGIQRVGSGRQPSQILAVANGQRRLRSSGTVVARIDPLRQHSATGDPAHWSPCIDAETHCVVQVTDKKHLLHMLTSCSDHRRRPACCHLGHSSLLSLATTRTLPLPLPSPSPSLEIHLGPIFTCEILQSASAGLTILRYYPTSSSRCLPTPAPKGCGEPDYSNHDITPGVWPRL